MLTENQSLEIHIRSLPRAPLFAAQFKTGVVLLSALGAGWLIWNVPPADTMDPEGMHFLATMLVAITFWMFDIFEDYVVGLMLLLAWVILGIVPAKLALAGFSENSWFFIIGSFGIAAAISKTSLLQRLALGFLRWLPIKYHKTYIAVLLSLGAFSSPLLPSGKARAAVTVPLTQAISQTAGFHPCSNGSATIALAAFVGFTQMQFMFLTGAEQNLMSWNLLPPTAKAEFGWLSWILVTLPAAIVISAFMFFAVQFLFPLSSGEKERLDARSIEAPIRDVGPISRKEWIVICTLGMTIVGWLTKSVHGVNEAWVALAALLVLLLTGALDKQTFKKEVDWSLILFFGVLNSMAIVAEHAKTDAWLMSIGGVVLARFAGQALSFLLIICLLISAVRFVLRKTPAAALFAVTVLPLSHMSGIHSGVLIVTAIMAGECFLFAYQDGPYQIAYGSAGGKAFSHTQARRVLAARYIATLLAITVSVPYWKYLGFIH
jgi:divalent anion:Na+ symporter, DASS family